MFHTVTVWLSLQWYVHLLYHCLPLSKSFLFPITGAHFVSVVFSTYIVVFNQDSMVLIWTLALYKLQSGLNAWSKFSNTLESHQANTWCTFDPYRVFVWWAYIAYLQMYSLTNTQDHVHIRMLGNVRSSKHTYTQGLGLYPVWVMCWQAAILLQ